MTQFKHFGIYGDSDFFYIEKYTIPRKISDTCVSTMITYGVNIEYKLVYSPVNSFHFKFDSIPVNSLNYKLDYITVNSHDYKLDYNITLIMFLVKDNNSLYGLNCWLYYSYIYSKDYWHISPSWLLIKLQFILFDSSWYIFKFI